MQLIVRTTAGRVNNLRIGPSRGPQGPAGPQGQVGATGPQGPKGDPGTTDYNELENLPDLTLKADKATTYTKTEVDTALTGKANTVHTHVASDVTNFNSSVSSNTDVSANTAARHTHANKTILDATSASYTTADETKLDGIEAGAQVNTVTSVAGKTGAVTLDKADVGLSNVDNTSDADKIISTATQTALDGKANFPSTDSHVPVRNGTGAQSSLRYTSGTTGYTIGFRTANGQIGVAGPTDNTHATNKGYVDTADALKVNKAGDIITGPLTVDGGLSPIVIRGNGASPFLNVTVANDNANAGTQNINERRLVKNSSGTLRPALEQFSYLTTPTAGAERSTVRYFTFSGGAQTKVMEFNGPDVLVENQLSVAGARYISGTGFPNGVVSAPVGSTYKNLDRGASWTGDIEWVKASGTGNTGWVVSVGDTGWRNVTADFSAAFTVVNPNDYGVYIRRTNGTVQISIKAQSVYSSWNGQTASLYPGFRLDNSAGTPVVVSEALQVAGAGRGQIQAGISLVFVSSTGIATGTRLYFSVSGAARTSEPWPTTLPGTAV